MKLCPYIERFIERYCIDNKLGACYKSISDITYHMVSASMACLACAQSLTWTLLIEGLSKATQMLQVNVALPNGHAELLSLPPSSTVQELKTTAQQAFRAKVSQTYHCQESSPSRSWQNLRRSRDRGRRVPYSSGTSTTTGSNKKCLCLVVLRRQRNHYLGCCRVWWWLFGSSRWAQGCAADSVHTVCICCDSCRWFRRCMGSCRLWRGQFGSSRSAHGRAADSGHRGGPSSRLLHLDVLGAPRALCWQKFRVRRGGKLTGHSLASCIKTCSAPSGSVLRIAHGVN